MPPKRNHTPPVPERVSSRNAAKESKPPLSAAGAANTELERVTELCTPVVPSKPFENHMIYGKKLLEEKVKVINRVLKRRVDAAARLRKIQIENIEALYHYEIETMKNQSVVCTYYIYVGFVMCITCVEIYREWVVGNSRCKYYICRERLSYYKKHLMTIQSIPVC